MALAKPQEEPRVGQQGHRLGAHPEPLPPARGLWRVAVLSRGPARRVAAHGGGRGAVETHGQELQSFLQVFAVRLEAQEAALADAAKELRRSSEQVAWCR